MGNGPKVTMKEIAALVNLSPATVSRVLHSPELVKPATRQRVLAAMEENQYVYDATAADLSRKKTMVIGLTIPTTKDAGFAASTLMIQEMAQAKGYSVILGNTHYDPQIELKVLRQFRERNVAGVILTGLCLGHEKVVHSLIESGIPCVVIWEKLSNDKINHVGFDNFNASYAMTEYLIQLNHRRIGFVAGLYSKISRVKKRVEGYKEALRAHQIPFDPELIVEAEPSLLDGKEAADRLLSLSNRPTAISFVSDVMAMGAMAAVRNWGFRVPEDISITGFDDIEYSAYMHPPLTTVRVPAEQMGRLSAKALFDMIETGNPAQVRQYCLDTDLIIRESCRKLA